MNTCSGRKTFGNFRILLDSGNRSTILIGELISKLKQKQSEKTTWETQAEKFAASNKVNIPFCLSSFSAAKIISCK